jgi:hypothetical protein
MKELMLNWFRRRPRKHAATDPAVMQKVLRMLALTEQDELACDAVYAVLDQFVDAAQRGENVLTLMPLVRQHLDLCPDCREEYEALLRMVQPSNLGAGA